MSAGVKRRHQKLMGENLERWKSIKKKNFKKYGEQKWKIIKRRFILKVDSIKNLPRSNETPLKCLAQCSPSKAGQPMSAELLRVCLMISLRLLFAPPPCHRPTNQMRSFFPRL